MEAYKFLNLIISTLNLFWTLVFCCTSSTSIKCIGLVFFEKSEYPNFALVHLNFIGRNFEF